MHLLDVGAYRECKEVEDFCAISPSICISVLSLTLIKEAVHLHELHRTVSGLACLQSSMRSRGPIPQANTSRATHAQFDHDL